MGILKSDLYKMASLEESFSISELAELEKISESVIKVPP